MKHWPPQAGGRMEGEQPPVPCGDVVKDRQNQDVARHRAKKEREGMIQSCCQSSKLWAGGGAGPGPAEMNKQEE